MFRRPPEVGWPYASYSVAFSKAQQPPGERVAKTACRPRAAAGPSCPSCRSVPRCSSVFLGHSGSRLHAELRPVRWALPGSQSSRDRGHPCPRHGARRRRIRRACRGREARAPRREVRDPGELRDQAEARASIRLRIPSRASGPLREVAVTNDGAVATLGRTLPRNPCCTRRPGPRCVPACTSRGASPCGARGPELAPRVDRNDRKGSRTCLRLRVDTASGSTWAEPSRTRRFSTTRPARSATRRSHRRRRIPPARFSMCSSASMSTSGKCCASSTESPSGPTRSSRDEGPRSGC